MGIDIFGWLRRKAHDAVLGGISDAMLEVAPGETAPPDLDGLRRMLATADVKALAAGEPASEEASEPEPTATSKRKR